MTLSHRRLPPSPSSHPKLVSSHPTTSAPANVRISHVQLRDLIVCPAERGVLWYVGDNGILEQDIISNTPPQTIASLKFTPVTLSTLRLASSYPGGKDVVILAAGGQDAELFLGMYLYHPRRTRQAKHQQNLYEPPLDTRPQETLHLSEDVSTEVDDNDDEIDLDVKEEEEQDEHPGYSTSVWQHTSSLVGSINNNVLLYMPPPPLHEHDLYEDNEEDREVSPRLVVSNNDCTVKFFDVCLARKGLRRPPALQRPQERAAAAVDTRYWRQDPGYAYRATYEGEGWEKGSEKVVRYERVGCLRLPVPVNHTSISPDGSTVLSCGDASTIYLHRILPVRDGSTLLFEPLATYTIPPPTPLPPLPPPSSSPVSQGRTFLHRYVGQNDPGGQYLPFAFVNGSWVLAGPHPYLSDVSGMEIPPACFTTAWSADGMRFAVASQEGMVRVWDVRSKEPLGCAGWETGPGGAAAAAAAASASASVASASASDATSGVTGTAQDGRDESLSSAIATAALNYDTQRALFEFTGGAPPWGVRSLKFARNASGREVLVFTEHVSRVHVIDADTFSRHDVLRIPHVQPSTSAAPQARDPHSHQYPRHHHHHHHHRSSGARLPVFRPPQPSSSTLLNTPPPSTNNAPTPTSTNLATQMYAIPSADLPRWLLDGAASANAGYSYVPNFLFNTSAVWRGAEDAAAPPRVGQGVDGASGANAAATAASTAAATPRLASRLEGRARARRLGLVPPRISRPPESQREGNNASSTSSTNLGAPTGRVLSPGLPLTRSPDPAGTTLFRTSLHDYGVEPERGEDAGNSGSDTDYQARLRRRYSAASSSGSRSGTGSGSGSGSGSAGTIGGGRAGRRDVMVRLREMERARRQGEAQEGSELRRRSPAILRSRDPVSAGAGVASGVEGSGESRLRDNAQMEEDIAFHAAREHERDRDRAELLYRIHEVRERIQAGREREQARAHEEREQELEREAAYAPVPEDAEGGPVLIPPLSSTRSEEDVRSVLAAHGIASVRSQALGAESASASAAVDAQEEGADDARSERSQVLFAADERRPGSSSSASSSSASSTTPSSISGVTGYTGITGVSTRAQAGSLVGEVHGASASADMGTSTVPYPHAASEPGAGDDFEANENPSTSLSTTTSQRRRRLNSTALMTPSIRNMRAAQAALRAMDEALDDYRMEVDEDVESHSHADPEQDVDLDEDRDAEGEEEESDSDATELDCAEPPSALEQGRTAEGADSSLNPEVSVSSSTSASLSSHVGTASTTQPPSSSSSISSPSFSTPFQPTHSRSQSLPVPQSQRQRQSVPQTQTQTQSQSQSQSQPQQQQQSQPQGQTLPPCRDLIESTDRLDIAGITFDPSGAYMYVATVDGITEWAVQGVEQRWWHTGGCL
ncbi:hypothetical protein A7U60_g935 [Sanghuangporus baumii]|uniref:DUF2415 domain-containing protein n=1 Tax=Sanghuangporus baumii TaxID=108892 RepID=A0A9Q5I5B2_SANBA|nr:hypothetical protein A7U60_g935 [Sanghuangporus baumii]